MEKEWRASGTLPSVGVAGYRSPRGHELKAHIDDRREVVAIRYFLSHTVDVN
jgi:hypothetical protein